MTTHRILPLFAAAIGLVAGIATAQSPTRIDSPTTASQPDSLELVMRLRNDQRAFATGLEAYFVDNDGYPPFTTQKDQYIGSPKLAEAQIPSFKRFEGLPGAASLTTPVSYLTRMFPDVSAGPDETYAYYSVKTETADGWIVWSPGPDKKYDLDWKLYNPDVKQPSPEILKFAYDSTNGAMSSGDVFRVKQ